MVSHHNSMVIILDSVATGKVKRVFASRRWKNGEQSQQGTEQSYNKGKAGRVMDERSKQPAWGGQ